MRPKARPTPTDQAADAAWETIMAIALEHALIIQSYGGVATLAVPQEQRKAGVRNQCLRAAGCETEGAAATITGPLFDADDRDINHQSLERARRKNENRPG